MRDKDSNNSSCGTLKPLANQMSFPEFNISRFYLGPDDEEDNKKDEDEKEKERDWEKEDSYASIQ